MSSEQIRRRLIYVGRVQGVGFRYTVTSIAKRYPVAGYVRNLRDGTVELVIEGLPADLASTLADIAEAFSGHIEECRSSDPLAAEPMTGFTIRR